ncbi:hypothetical protein [Pelagibacterium xiamenense]|uniref:hypothetical protein n=1 Tax=Pelagibacterium xiamenense TaxID=2901140 RepID=UPI001E539336|nr:hypothetical protein [Pelagibacterium xiamenense]MCD7060759.1 hypothetical protein [Pelagibacterium xiamenense]
MNVEERAGAAMITPVPRGGHSIQAAGGASTRGPYRVAICVFPDVAGALGGLAQIAAHGVSMSDMVLIAPSRQAAAELLAGEEICPAIFACGQPPDEPEWRQIGRVASRAARRLADVSDWASERTALTMRHDLSLACVVLLVYGLREMLQALMADVLLNVAALRVEVHDIPPGHLAS